MALTPHEQAEALSIDLQGDFAGILAIAMKDGTPLKDNALADSLRLVASCGSAGELPPLLTMAAEEGIRHNHPFLKIEV